MKPHLIQLRPALETDIEFCYRVKKEALQEYVAVVWGWDEAFQQDFHRQDFGIRKPDIVSDGSLDVGTIEVSKYHDHIHLGEFYLLPQVQRQGIGTFLLQQVLENAKSAGLPVRLEVLKINPAQSLYKKNGFVMVGEREHHWLMEWNVLDSPS